VDNVLHADGGGEAACIAQSHLWLEDNTAVQQFLLALSTSTAAGAPLRRWVASINDDVVDATFYYPCTLPSSIYNAGRSVNRASTSSVAERWVRVKAVGDGVLSISLGVLDSRPSPIWASLKHALTEIGIPLWFQPLSWTFGGYSPIALQVQRACCTLETPNAAVHVTCDTFTTALLETVIRHVALAHCCSGITSAVRPQYFQETERSTFNLSLPAPFLPPYFFDSTKQVISTWEAALVVGSGGRPSSFVSTLRNVHCHVLSDRAGVCGVCTRYDRSSFRTTFDRALSSSKETFEVRVGKRVIVVPKTHGLSRCADAWKNANAKVCCDCQYYDV
jgi:hypothetical protein